MKKFLVIILFIFLNLTGCDQQKEDSSKIKDNSTAEVKKDSVSQDTIESISNIKVISEGDENAKIKITIGKGIQLKSPSNPSRVASMGAANFLKSGRCVNNHSLMFLSIHSAIGT